MTQTRIFILDDEADIVRALAARLEAEGSLLIESASDPEEALAKIPVFAPHVALIDIMLPKFDGWEVCRRLRADPATKNVALVVMTAIMSRPLLKKAFEEKVSVVTKPLTDRELAKVIEAAVPAPPPAGPA